MSDIHEKQGSISPEQFEYWKSQKMYFVQTDEYDAWSKEAFEAYLSIRQDDIYRHMVGTMQHILHETNYVGPEITVKRIKALEKAFLEVRKASQ